MYEVYRFMFWVQCRIIIYVFFICLNLTAELNYYYYLHIFTIGNFQNNIFLN